MKKNFKSMLAALLTFSMLATNCVMVLGAETKENAVKTTYSTVEEICDWGAATTKVIVDLKQEVKQGSVNKDTFGVNVVRTDKRVQQTPLSEGSRTVTDAYVSDEKGNKVENGKYAAIVMEIGPKIELGSPLNYYSGSNVWIDCAYTITQKNPITNGSAVISGLIADKSDKRIVPLVDEFKEGSSTYKDKTFGDIKINYASYTPKASTNKKPLIIWLHGGGEGGTDVTIPISANKACNLASPEIQAYFKDGAYVLAPQSPTKWMSDGKSDTVKGSEKTNADSMYTEALMNLIQEYVKNNSSIDANRIYIGGCSNGGFMTLRMLMSYPDYFAAAYPVCEGVNDKYITDKDIETLKDIPMWFVCAASDDTLVPSTYTIPTYERLIKAGAKNVHLNYFDRVVDTTGLYKDADGNPHEYDGHWSWTYVYNNKVSNTIGDKEMTIMEWLAAQKK